MSKNFDTDTSSFPWKIINVLILFILLLVGGILYSGYQQGEALHMAKAQYQNDKKFEHFSYRIHGNTVEITDYPRSVDGVVYVPATIDGLPVTEIGESAFERCRWMTKIYLPNTVTRIGERAFADCFKLRGDIPIPPKLQYLGERAFYNCGTPDTLVRELVLPNTLTHVGFEAFTSMGSFR